MRRFSYVFAVCAARTARFAAARAGARPDGNTPVFPPAAGARLQFYSEHRIISPRGSHTKPGGEDHMSPKELAYIEDALGHEQHLQQKCCDYANRLQDAELANFVRQLSGRHQQAMAQLFQLIK